MRRLLTVISFSFVVLAWCVFQASAADVVWVYQGRGDGGGVAPAAGGGNLAWEDDQWRALLEDNGHTIIAHDYFDDLEFDPSGLDILNSADLVIFSRDINSGDYNDPAEQMAWTEELTSPMLILSAFVLRNSRWQMTNTGGNPIALDPLEAVDPSHPVFAGVTLDANNQVDVWDEQILGDDANINITDPPDVGNGTLIAVESTTGNPWIIHWDTGVEFYDGSLYIAGGPRMFFGAGSDDDPYSWGEKNLTPAGDQIFLNAVNFMAGVDTATPLQAGDANQDLEFNQLDLVKVQIAAKYLSGTAATWGQGDWNGAPGGQQGSPPVGNGFFDQLDIIAALAGGKYLTGPYGAVNPGGKPGDAQTSVGYNPSTGEVFVDAPAGTNLTSINIDSAAEVFTGDPAQGLGGSFDNDADGNVFKATFGSSFGSLSFGNVAQAGLSEEFVMGDLTVVGSLAGGGDLGAVDLIYVPEPSSVMLAVLAIVGLMAVRRRRS